VQWLSAAITYPLALPQLLLLLLLLVPLLLFLLLLLLLLPWLCRPLMMSRCGARSLYAFWISPSWRSRLLQHWQNEVGGIRRPGKNSGTLVLQGSP
jgi:hypothetical protein